MIFKYELDGIGWAYASFKTEQSDCFFNISYLSDALKLLLEGIMALIPECMPEDELKSEVQFEWHCEPGGYVWFIKCVDNNTFHIRIEGYEDIFEKLGMKTEMDEKIDKIKFIKCIIEEMDALLESCGFIGYRESWRNHDFPITAFLKLKNYINTGKRFVTEVASGNYAEGHTKSDIRKEIEMIIGRA